VKEERTPTGKFRRDVILKGDMRTKIEIVRVKKFYKCAACGREVEEIEEDDGKEFREYS